MEDTNFSLKHRQMSLTKNRKPKRANVFSQMFYNQDNQKKLKVALGQSFTPPKSEQGQAFVNSISYPKASYKEVVFSQLGFIRKRVWLSFFICIIFANAYTTHAEISINIITALSVLLPLFSLVTVTEVSKSTAYNMEEMELACKYNLSRIMLMRLAILGTVSFLVLILCVIFVGDNNFGAFRNFMYLSVPYLISTNASLFLITKLKSKETTYICTAVSGAVSLFMLIANRSYTFIYSVNFTVIWSVVFLALTGIMLIILIRFKHSQEELQWNFV